MIKDKVLMGEKGVVQEPIGSAHLAGDVASVPPVLQVQWTIASRGREGLCYFLGICDIFFGMVRWLLCSEVRIRSSLPYPCFGGAPSTYEGRV
jgi:hypothetical protein